MNKIGKLIRTTGLVLVLTGCIAPVQAQFLKKLGKAAEKAAERTVERRIEQETEEKTDQALDSIFEKDNKGQGSPVPADNGSGPLASDTGGDPQDTGQKSNDRDHDSADSAGSSSQKSTVAVNRASDFEPGAVPVLVDDFSKDNQGDFPAKWDTNGSGEIVIIDGTKWFRLGGNTTYVPLTEETLPENYTVEFDLLVQGLDRKTSSHSFIKLLVEDTPLFKKPRNFAMVELSPCPWTASIGVVEKVVDGERQLRNKIGKDYRTLIDGKSRISIAVNKTRMRVWINENKLVDIPRLVPEAANTFKISTYGLRDDPNKDEVYISDFRMGKAGTDNRSKLITEGRLTTTAIQFESGSDALRPESYQTIREISGVLEDNPNVQIKIIGHTDAEGDEASNLELSKKRASAVKNAMGQMYGIAGNRIVTDGKGETEPVADNGTQEGMAENRRVEFVKL